MKPAKIFLFLSMLCCFTACSLDEPFIKAESDEASKIQLNGCIDQLYQTRVNDSGFCNGDVIGVYVVDYDGENAGTLDNNYNRATNVRHTFNEGKNKWTPAYDIYYKDKKTPVDIYAYYPFTDIENVNDVAFEIQKDQSTTAALGILGGYEASDFLFGKTERIMPTSSVVNVSLKHIMASVRITLEEGTGFSDGEWKSIEKSIVILNSKRKTSVNLATGDVIVSDEFDNSAIIPYQQNSDYRAVVAPQVIAAQTKLFGITIDGMSYTFSKEEDITYVQGKQNNFTIRINKKVGTGYELVLSSESITPWENDPISHDAISKEYVIVNVENAGTLDECLVNAGLDITKVRNIKLTGQINSRDFAVMRYKMTSLAALNLKDVIIVAGESGFLDGLDYSYCDNNDDDIPVGAMYEKESLTSLVLPDKLKSISGSSSTGAFTRCINLTGSLIIPEGVEVVGPAAFLDCKNLTGTLTLPSTLKVIGSRTGYIGYWDGTFKGCGFVCELKIPESVEVIGMGSFQQCSNLYGELRLPDGLKELGASAFESCENLIGSLTIPQGITNIPESCFYSCGFNGTLSLHDGINTIADNAFKGCRFKGELHLPKNLETISKNCFYGCDFSGTLVLPKGLKSLGDWCFAYNWRLMETVEIPENVISIGAYAFAYCRSLDGVIFPKDLENIKNGAFLDCFGIGRIVCKGSIPAYLQNGAFDGVPKDNFTLEVPESAIHVYQTEAGWKDFKRIAAYRDLVIRPQLATAINTSVTRNLLLNAEGEWYVESQPDWVTLDKTTGIGKTEIKLTFSQMPAGINRSGEVVFMLKGKDYRTRCSLTQYDYKYGEDEWITLQSATKGKGVNIVFLGDGYNAKDISEGKLLADMEQSVEHYFSIEPYKTYRDYFNIYTAISVSAESGVGTVNTIVYNRFGTTFKGGVNVSARDQDFTTVFNYAIAGNNNVTQNNLNQSLIVMIPNTEDYGGICYMWDDGSAIAYCPKSDFGYPLDWRGTIQHEAGGHGFGKLGDEYIYHNVFIDYCGCSCCGHVLELEGAFAKGWYPNLSLSGKMSEVKWSHLIFHEKYNQIVDIFEGGYMHSRGVYRSEQNSCMNNEIPYYNTISREEIVKRIMQYAGEVYSFDKFVENDKIEVLSETRGGASSLNNRPAMHQHAPVFMGKKPNLSKH